MGVRFITVVISQNNVLLTVGDTGPQAGVLSPSSPTFRFERVSGDLPGQQITSGDCPIQVVKERAQPNLA